MKKYQLLSEFERTQQAREKYDELKLFQDLLRNSIELNEKYYGKAIAIADGLQPWIDALELDLKG